VRLSKANGDEQSRTGKQHGERAATHEVGSQGAEAGREAIGAVAYHCNPRSPTLNGCGTESRRPAPDFRPIERNVIEQDGVEVHALGSRSTQRIQVVGWTAVARSHVPNRPDSLGCPKLMGLCRAQGLPEHPACPPFKVDRQRRWLGPLRVAIVECRSQANLSKPSHRRERGARVTIAPIPLTYSIGAS
jgi:hypothetical protein